MLGIYHALLLTIKARRNKFIGRFLYPQQRVRTPQ